MVGTFEPFLAKCAAVRMLRVIEGIVLRGIRVEGDRSMQGLMGEETEGHLRKTEIFPTLPNNGM